MSLDALQAMKAYGAAAAKAAQGAASGDPAAAAGGDFAKLVADAVKDTEGALKSAETMTARAASGQAELVDVVTAITSAEVTLETVVAVRDEVIKAYQEILRMPI